jgi:hypothetical protein
LSTTSQELSRLFAGPSAGRRPRSRSSQAKPAFFPLLALVLFAFFTSSAPAAAQVIGGPRPVQTADRELGFLTRYHVHTQAASLKDIGDAQFGWDTDLGVDMDVFDLLFARGSVFFNLETGVGEERRAIDPTQTNYTMDLSVFTRLPRGEFGVTFHHISRHRADREHPGSPSWNMLGLSYGDRLYVGSFDVEFMGRWLGTITSSEVDYEQEVNTYLRVLRPLNGRVSLIGELDGSAVLTDESMFGRTRQYGGSAHLGLRFRGGAGAGEILIGRERRVDPDIFVRRSKRWTRLAFRFVLD